MDAWNYLLKNLLHTAQVTRSTECRVNSLHKDSKVHIFVDDSNKYKFDEEIKSRLNSGNAWCHSVQTFWILVRCLKT
jgi:hypothetical protein